METAKEQIRALLDAGLAAFRRSRLDEAEKLLQRALKREPRIARAQDLLARVYYRQGRYNEAEGHARRAVALSGTVALYHDTLAHILVASGRSADALEEFRGTAAAAPDDFRAHFGLAALLAAMGKDGEVLAALENARRIDPRSQEVRKRMAACHLAARRFEETLTLVNEMLAAGVEDTGLHAMAGRAMYGLNDPAGAAMAYEAALRLNDRVMEHYTGLSAALFQAGRKEAAQQITGRFLTRFPSYSRKAAKPEATVLVLSALGQGCFTKPRMGSGIFAYSNTIGQIPAERFTFHHIFVNHPDPVAAARAQPPVDAIFNDVANAEAAQRNGFTETVRKIADTLGVPVINAPEAVARTTRQENSGTIPDGLNILFPRTVCHELGGRNTDEVRGEIMESIAFPLLLRRLETHFDETVPLVADEAALGRILDEFQEAGVGQFYAIEYLTEPFRPGVFRKLRCALIDGVFHPSFCDFSEHWNVHRLDAETAFMKANVELMDEERTFLGKPADYIGAENIEKLEALARLLDLEFLGVDFNVLGDGNLVIFEANPAMRVLQSRLLKDFPYFTEPCQRLRDAFERMLLLKSRASGRCQASKKKEAAG